MNKIEVFDPPMCCSTGVCGTDVDPKLVQFATDLAWLKEQGASVARYGLAQQPSAFVGNPAVAEALKAQGNDCLPLILVNGTIMTRSIYPTREQLVTLAGIEEAGGGCCDGEAEEEGCCGGGESESSGCCC